MSKFSVLLIVAAITIGLVTSLVIPNVFGSSKGLKLFLTVKTNLDDDMRINTYQYDGKVFTHYAVMHQGSNEVTLNYPRGLIDNGEFRVCVASVDFDKSACDNAYNSEAKQPEHVYINLFLRDSPPATGGDSQAQSQAQDQDQSQSQSNTQQTTIINCPANSRCVIDK
jgi:hypothetical protein